MLQQAWLQSKSPLHSTENRRKERRNSLYSTDPGTQSKSKEEGERSVSVNENDGWVPGDVDTDLALLRMVIAESRADYDRKAKERIFLSEELARGRRPLYPDLLRFVVSPVALAIWISFALDETPWAAPTKLARVFPLSSTKTMAGAFVAVMNLQYWAFAIASPIVMLVAKRWLLTKPANSAPPRESRWDMDYENPQTSCRDHILCLLENWTSSVLGAMALGLFSLQMLRSRRAVLLPAGNTQAACTVAVALAASRMLNRLGAAAALNQYPKLMYRLWRADQPRPLPAFTTLLQQMVTMLLVFLPFGFASDLASIRLAASSNGGSNPLASALLSRKADAVMLIAGSAVSPVIHLVALARIIEIKFCTDIPLTNDCSVGSAAPSTTVIRSSRLKRRYWLRWRTPKRLSRVLRKWWRDDFILRGRGPLSDEGHRYDALPLIFGDGPGESGVLPGLFDRPSRGREPELPILQKIAEDEEKGFFEERPDRAAWPEMATKRMAAKHQRNFENKNFEDPLGIAVQQTFGIGLNYDFDYDAPVKKGEKPSVHILRARAARSAIRHCRDLEESMRQRLDVVEDAEERMKLGLDMSRRLGAEKRRLADALLELVPAHAGTPDGRKLESIQAISESDARSLLRSRAEVSDPDSFVTTYGETPLSDGPIDDPFLDRKYVNDLLRMSKPRIAAEMYESEKWGDGDGPHVDAGDDDDINDDYVSEWMKRSFGGGDREHPGGDSDDVKDGRGGPETYLV